MDAAAAELLTNVVAAIGLVLSFGLGVIAGLLS